MTTNRSTPPTGSSSRRIRWLILGVIGPLILLLAAASPLPSEASHAQNPWYQWPGDIWRWLIDPANAPYSGKTLIWRPCGDLTNLGISVDEGFLDWEHKFGYAIAIRSSWSCGPFQALTVYGTDEQSTINICGVPTACFVKVTSWYDANLGWWTINDAYIYVNANRVRSKTPAEQKHWFAHEFGHGMALLHHSNCGQGVMTPEGCTDLVSSSDVVLPRCYYLYTC